MSAEPIFHTLTPFLSCAVTGSFAGGHRITVTGTGLYDDVSVSVCGETCRVTDSPTTASLVCDTPAHSGTCYIGLYYVNVQCTVHLLGIGFCFQYVTIIWWWAVHYLV